MPGPVSAMIANRDIGMPRLRRRRQRYIRLFRAGTGVLMRGPNVRDRTTDHSGAGRAECPGQKSADDNGLDIGGAMSGISMHRRRREGGDVQCNHQVHQEAADAAEEVQRLSAELLAE